MSWPKLQIVASPNVGATVLYDFNIDSLAKAGHEGFDLGAPEWRGTPGASGGTDGYRTIKFSHWVDSETKAQTALVTLGQLLLKDKGWLLIQQRQAAAPVWARIWRSTPGALSWDRIMVRTGDGQGSAKGKYALDINLTADPYLVGSSTQLASAVTVNNDPAAGTNPCYMVLGAVVGDTPAPVIINADPVDATTFPGYRWMFSLHSGPTSRTPVVWQIGTSDGWTAGTDTAAATANAAYSNGSYRAVSFATQTGLFQRLSGAAPAALAPGRYKVLCRLARSDASTTFSLAFGVGFTLESGGAVQYRLGDTVQMDRSPSSTSGHATYVDLGNFQFPVGIDPTDAANGSNATPSVTLYVGRTSGTGQANLDCLVLIPLQTTDTTLTTTLVDGFIGTSAVAVTWDGETERVWGLDGSNVTVNLLHQLQGSFLYAVPGAANIMTLFRQVNGQHPRTIYFGTYPGTPVDGSDAITQSTSVTVTYRPRWLWPRP